MADRQSIKLSACFPIHFSGTRISHTCLEICKHMNGDGLAVDIVAPSRSGAGKDPIVQPVFPDTIGRILGRVNRRFVAAATERSFLDKAKTLRAAYLWSNFTSGFLRQMSDSSTTVFVEKFNHLVGDTIEILNEAYDRAGLKPGHGLTQEKADLDLERLSAADYIFLVNPYTKIRALEIGIPPGKIIDSTYGWSPDRLATTNSRTTDSRATDRLTFCFVGVAEIRKGVNLLLDAWSRAGVDGRLLLAGPIPEAVAVLCKDALNRPDVETTGWIDDVSSIYRQADVFVLPSHEEGSPLVVYEAMAHGLPTIVSPMAAGHVVRHEQEGFVIDPYDTDAWVDAIRRLSADIEFRKTMGQSARERAQMFTWDKVGAARRKEVLARLE